MVEASRLAMNLFEPKQVFYSLSPTPYSLFSAEDA